MLRYLHALRNALKKVSFFGFELVIVSIVLHSFMLFFLFVVYNPVTSSDKINLRECKIQFLALQQQKSEKNIVACNTGSSSKLVQANKSTIKPTTTIKKQETKKVPPTKVAQLQKPVSKATPPKPQVPKPEVKKKPELAKKVTPTEKPTSKIAQTEKPIQKEISASLIPDQIEIPSIDTNTLLIMEYVINEVQKWWSPIPGLPEDIEVELDFCVGDGGIISDVNIIKSSGVLVFDIQARNLFSQSDHQWPRWAWGKMFELSLPNKSEL